MANINEVKIELLQHAPYSPDLAPSDYISKFEKMARWQNISNIEEVKSAVDGYFNELDSLYYKQGIEVVEHRWENCVELQGDYVEK